MRPGPLTLMNMRSYSVDVRITFLEKRLLPKYTALDKDGKRRGYVLCKKATPLTVSALRYFSAVGFAISSTGRMIPPRKSSVIWR